MTTIKDTQFKLDIKMYRNDLKKSNYSTLGMIGDSSGKYFYQILSVLSVQNMRRTISIIRPKPRNTAWVNARLTPPCLLG